MIYLNYSLIYQVISDIFLYPLILLRSILEENDGWQKLIKRGVYTSDIEEAAIPCYMSLVNFGAWSHYNLTMYYNLMVGMIFNFSFILPVVLYWSWSFQWGGDGIAEEIR